MMPLSSLPLLLLPKWLFFRGYAICLANSPRSRQWIAAPDMTMTHTSFGALSTGPPSIPLSPPFTPTSYLPLSLIESQSCHNSWYSRHDKTDEVAQCPIIVYGKALRSFRNRWEVFFAKQLVKPAMIYFLTRGDVLENCFLVKSSGTRGLKAVGKTIILSLRLVITHLSL